MPASIRYRVILVGVDFSKPSRAALDHAIGLARRLGSRLEVVHVAEEMQPAIPFSRENRAVVERLRKETAAEAERRLSDLLPRSRLPTIRMRILTGTPAVEILTYAERVRADLIVLAHRGHNVVENLLLGSTAETVVRKTRRPVLLVPPQARGLSAPRSRTRAGLR
jgi:nucleotide-binding universal stress UspA family protein